MDVTYAQHENKEKKSERGKMQKYGCHPGDLLLETCSRHVSCLAMFKEGKRELGVFLRYVLVCGIRLHRTPIIEGPLYHPAGRRRRTVVLWGRLWVA